MARKGPYIKFEDDPRQQVKKENLADFSKNLDSAVKAKGMTNWELAEKTGMLESSISQYRNGIQFPANPQKLIKLADALDTSIDALMGHDYGHEPGKAFYMIRTDDNVAIGDMLGLSPEAVSVLMKIKSNAGRTLSEMLDRLILSDCFEEFLQSSYDSSLSISRRYREAYDSASSGKNRGETLLRFNGTRKRLAFLEVLSASESLKPALMEALGYNELTGYIQELENSINNGTYNTKDE